MSIEILSMTDKPVSVRQVKAARALLTWSQADLAEFSGVSEPTIARLESIDGLLGGRSDTVEKITNAIVAAGVEFLPDDTAGGEGVRIRKRGRGLKSS
jgi:transcriptional regulator with XRE-family HTH domain